MLTTNLVSSSFTDQPDEQVFLFVIFNEQVLLVQHLTNILYISFIIQKLENIAPFELSIHIKSRNCLCVCECICFSRFSCWSTELILGLLGNSAWEVTWCEWDQPGGVVMSVVMSVGVSVVFASLCQNQSNSILLRLDMR